MKIGVIGVGKMTLNLAKKAAQSGFTVLVNNPDAHGNNLLKDVFLKEKNIILAETSKAASAEIILLSLRYENLEEVLMHFPDMKGKVIVSVNNPVFNPHYAGTEIASGPNAAKTALLLPGADVIKLYNLIHPSLDNYNKSENAHEKFFFSGQNQNAKNKIKDFLEKLNFSGIDLENKTGIQKVN